MKESLASAIGGLYMLSQGTPVLPMEVDYIAKFGLPAAFGFLLWFFLKEQRQDNRRAYNLLIRLAVKMGVDPGEEPK